MVAQYRQRVAIIGLGSQGLKHWFENLQDVPQVSVCAVCDSNAAVLDDFGSRHAEIPAYKTVERLLEHHCPDFAIVCVPNRYHLAVIKKLEQVGVPCLKEKPIASTVDEFHQLCSVRTKIGVTFQRRWQPRYVHLSHLLAEIGRPLSVRAIKAGKYDPPQYGWRVRHNVGTFEDLGVHMLDVLVWLFGRPCTVFARCLSDDHQPSARDRESHVFMHWQKSEIVGHLYVSEVAQKEEESLVVRGTRGSLHLKGNEIVHYDVAGRQTFQVGFQSLKRDMIVNMCQEFGEYISDKNGTFPTSVSQVEDTLLTTEAIRLSFASHNLEQVAQPHQQNGCQNGVIKTADRHSKSKSGDMGIMQSIGHAELAAAAANGVSAQSVPEGNVAQQKTFLLNSGFAMPGLGFGTRKPKRPRETFEAVAKALQVGYRHIDTAFRYNNEDQVGEAVRDSGLARQQVWITTKIDNSWHHRVAESVSISLARLGMEYLDLVLMKAEQHWPSPVDPDDAKKALPEWDFIMTWQDMQKEIQAGRVRSIGVSNFGMRNLQKLMTHPTCTVVPAVNQIELHPYCPSNALISFCNQNGIHCTAYSPLAFGLPELHSHRAMVDLCTRTGKTSQQILIRWGLQRGTSVIPKSVTPQRIAANFEALNWELTDEDHGQLSSIKDRRRVYPDDWLPAQVFWEEEDD